MKAKLWKKILSAGLCVPLVAFTTPIEAGAAMESQTTAASPICV